MVKRLLFLFVLLISELGFGQPINDACSNAIELCPNVAQNINNIAATNSTCSTCEDYITTCFTPINSVWVTFTTTNGGNSSFSISSVQYQPVNNDNNSLSAVVIQAGAPCDNSTFTIVDCLADQVSDFFFGLTGLLPDTRYYVMISGTQNGPGAIDPTEAKMDVTVSGPAVSRNGYGVVYGASKQIFCKGDPTELKIDTSNCPGQKTFKWYKNGALWFTGNSIDFSTDELELNDQIYVQCNCFDVCPIVSNSNTITFTVLDFTLDAGPDYSIHQSESVQFQAQTNSQNYFWTPSEYLSDATSLTAIATPPSTTTYFLTASNGICTKTDYLTVTVSSQLDIPTVFSPNGDGIDDTWKILGIENFPDASVDILDRWGQRVFQSVGYSSQKWWDGTSPSGKPLATSTYYYVIKFNDVNKTVQKGPITIMR